MFQSRWYLPCHWLKQLPHSSKACFLFYYLSLLTLGFQVWKISKKYVRNAFKGHKGRITSLEFSPEGNLLISASRDNSVRIWNMHDGAVKVFTQENHGSFYSATLSPSGIHVAAGHSDGAIRIWDVLTGHLVHKLIGHDLWVGCVAFTPDGTGLVSAGGDVIMKYWDLSSLEIFRPGRRRRPHQASERKKDPTESGSQAEPIQPSLLQEFSGHVVCQSCFKCPLF